MKKIIKCPQCDGGREMRFYMCEMCLGAREIETEVTETYFSYDEMLELLIDGLSGLDGNELAYLVNQNLDLGGQIKYCGDSLFILTTVDEDKHDGTKKD